MRERNGAQLLFLELHLCSSQLDRFCVPCDFLLWNVPRLIGARCMAMVSVGGEIYKTRNFAKIRYYRKIFPIGAGDTGANGLCLYKLFLIVGTFGGIRFFLIV